MEIVVLGIHLLVAVCLIFLVLMQRSEGGALGMGGGGGSLMSGRGAADALARMTSVAGGFFLVTSLGLTMLSGADAANAGRSVLDSAPAQSAPVTLPITPPREDPTESSLPSETLLAAAEQPPSAALPAVATPVSTPARAAPLETTQPPPRSQPAAATTRTAATTPAATTRTTSTAQPQRTTQQRPPTGAPAVTTSSGAVSGINLTEDPAAAVESSQNSVDAVRRERAGPDQ